MVGKMFELSANTLKLTDITSIGANGSKVSCVLRWIASKPNGSTMEVDNIDVYTVENGQIVKAEIFSADLEKENQFWV
uniref:SnoaL-like domain-containing protein n=2 Tax=cellular organisms TaxID=131567 RepID=A0AC34GN99_9BILA